MFVSITSVWTTPLFKLRSKLHNDVIMKLLSPKFISFHCFKPGVDRGRDFRPRPRKIQLVKTEAEDNQGFFFLAEAEAEECKF